MAVRQKGSRFYVYFKWKGIPVETVTSAKTEPEAKRIDKAVRTAFRISRFDHLKPEELEVVVRTFENRGWKLPAEIRTAEPEEELTLLKGIKDYLKIDPKHRSERNMYAIDRLVEHFGENKPVEEIRVAQIKQYRRERLEKVQNGTVNREMGVLSGIFNVQIELESLDSNPCRMTRSLPENQRDSYLSWEDFNRLMDQTGWISDLIVLLYFTGMRFGEAAALRWEMYKPERRMLVLPPKVTKEGKSSRKVRLKPKRVPLRGEAVDLLESFRKRNGEKVVQAMGLIFGYSGHYLNRSETPQGKPLDRFMVRKCWRSAVKATGLDGLQMRDLRHTWKTNAQRSGMHPAIANAIVGHASVRPVEDRYIRVSDEDLLKAVDEMGFDMGWTELDVVEVTPPEPEDGMERVRKPGEQKKKVTG